ncbi:zinc-dependent alcohol dehydrogenase [Paenibacillus nasutitermitis]|uniref:Galactitol-1-phosphate 5-dehydrogenase n=1 Tax=Paenibacillus nasutitermitis TaxID=1652958 RepID=A0A916ZG94_9BACL|nr:galactitol-1-phosphate 5-dehydrogenase [Paenibacillus nasutitermitis]GGD93692.1 galactitol-1-phosphate 5-dehydrogenase [Paenibacillus nasutitermitis]
MKALVYLGPERMEMMDVPVPVPDPGEVLIKVAFSGICGSELSGYLGHNALRKPPLIFGHEFSGTIVETGGQSLGLREGMRVTANPLITCGKCSYCVRGVESLCLSRKLLSAALPGSNAEYVKVPAEFVHPLQDHVSLENGALTEPVACGVRVAELTAAGSEDTVLVTGMGPIGLFALQAVLHQGAKRVIAVDLSGDRLAVAAGLGAHTVNPREQDVDAYIRDLTDGKGVSAAIDAVGSAITRQQCVASVSNGGKVVFTGLHQADTNLDINDVVRREIKLFGSFAYSKSNFQTALEWISAKKIGLGDRLTVAGLNEGAFWFDKLNRAPGKEMKVLLSLNGFDQ